MNSARKLILVSSVGGRESSRPTVMIRFESNILARTMSGTQKFIGDLLKFFPGRPGMKKRIRFLVVIALAVSLCVPIESALAGKVQIINNCKMGVYFELYNNASVGIWRRVSATTDYLDPNGVYTSSAECVMLVKFGYNRYEYQCTRECLWAKGRWDLGSQQVHMGAKIASMAVGGRGARRRHVRVLHGHELQLRQRQRNGLLQ